MTALARGQNEKQVPRCARNDGHPPWQSEKQPRSGHGMPCPYGPKNWLPAASGEEVLFLELADVDASHGFAEFLVGFENGFGILEMRGGFDDGFGAGFGIAGFEDAAADEDGFSAERSEEHTSELQSRRDLVCRLLLEK